MKRILLTIVNILLISNTLIAQEKFLSGVTAIKTIDGIEYYEDGKIMSRHTIDSSGIGTLTDFRDNQTYKTITFTIFGDIQQTWMAQNLNFKTETSISYETNKKLRKKFPSMENAGMAYTWADAMEACPSGWHLPSQTNWELLIEYLKEKEITGNALKSSKFWHKDRNGTNISGFNALPTGSLNYSGKIGGELGKNVTFFSPPKHLLMFLVQKGYLVIH